MTDLTSELCACLSKCINPDQHSQPLHQGAKLLLTHVIIINFSARIDICTPTHPHSHTQTDRLIIKLRVSLFSPQGGGATGAERRGRKCVCVCVWSSADVGVPISIPVNLDGVLQAEETARQQQINTRDI